MNLKTIIKETDHSFSKLNFPGTIILSDKGPTIKPIFIGPKISKPKWFQFWRWHLILRYKRECRKASNRFDSMFGKPKKKK